MAEDEGGPDRPPSNTSENRGTNDIATPDEWRRSEAAVHNAHNVFQQINDIFQIKPEGNPFEDIALQAAAYEAEEQLAIVLAKWARHQRAYPQLFTNSEKINVETLYQAISTIQQTQTAQLQTWARAWRSLPHATLNIELPILGDDTVVFREILAYQPLQSTTLRQNDTTSRLIHNTPERNNPIRSRTFKHFTTPNKTTMLDTYNYIVNNRNNPDIISENAEFIQSHPSLMALCGPTGQPSSITPRYQIEDTSGILPTEFAFPMLGKYAVPLSKTFLEVALTQIPQSIKPFDGTFECNVTLGQLWRHFYKKIHSIKPDQASFGDKLIVLQKLLKGDAARTIQHLNATVDDEEIVYVQAWKELFLRYGDEQSTLRKTLDALPTIKPASYDVKGMTDHFQVLESIYYRIRGAKWDEHEAAQKIMSNLTSYLPKEVLLNYLSQNQIKLKNKETFYNERPVDYMNDLLDHCKQYFNFLRTENTFDDGVTPAFAAVSTQQPSLPTTSTEQSPTLDNQQGGQIFAFQGTNQTGANNGGSGSRQRGRNGIGRGGLNRSSSGQNGGAKAQQNDSRSASDSKVNSGKLPKCYFCPGLHYNRDCPLSPQQKNDAIKQQAKCFRCLRKGHSLAECTFPSDRMCSQPRCVTKRNHNPLLCLGKPAWDEWKTKYAPHDDNPKKRKLLETVKTEHKPEDAASKTPSGENKEKPTDTTT
jgi:hypothetical protein